MVTILHTLGHGGIVWNGSLTGINYDVAWLLEIMSFCAVNCYAMISGYVGINSQIKYYKLIYFWLQLVFSGLLIAFLCSIFQPEWVNVNIWKDAIFPIYRKEYWYMTAYFGLFLLLPIINAGINSLLSQQRKILFYTISLFLIILPYFAGQDLFFIVNGYSLMWLLFCYIIGTLLAKENLFVNQSKTALFFIYLFAVLITAYLNRINIRFMTVMIQPSGGFGGKVQKRSNGA
nr:acyltransferase family protein [Actinobacillus porcinus]